MLENEIRNMFFHVGSLLSHIKLKNDDGYNELIAEKMHLLLTEKMHEFFSDKWKRIINVFFQEEKCGNI